MSSSYDLKPWYIQKKKNQLGLLNGIHENYLLKFFFHFIDITKKIIAICYRLFFSIVFGVLAGICVSKLFSISLSGQAFLLFVSLTICFLWTAIYFFIAQIGSICVFFMEQKYHYSKFVIGLFYLQSKIEKSNPKKGLLAPEMILRQFLQQVRIYAGERNYYNQKLREQNPDYAPEPQPQDSQSNETILKRRWNDIQDTLDEFDIYLANNPHDIIEKLVATSFSKNSDVSHIFREVAETAESTWRAKGVQIEHAIVVPLKANINDRLLKRLLAGPWRSCAYFSAKGNGVVFSAKSENGKIIAHWECQGVTYPNKFFDLIKNQSLSVNARIEQGMELIANDPKNSNILFGLISLIIWHDLAKASLVDFNILQGNDGMNINLKF